MRIQKHVIFRCKRRSLRNFGAWSRNRKRNVVSKNQLNCSSQRALDEKQSSSPSIYACSPPSNQINRLSRPLSLHTSFCQSPIVCWINNAHGERTSPERARGRIASWVICRRYRLFEFSIRPTQFRVWTNRRANSDRFTARRRDMGAINHTHI